MARAGGGGSGSEPGLGRGCGGACAAGPPGVRDLHVGQHRQAEGRAGGAQGRGQPAARRQRPPVPAAGPLRVECQLQLRLVSVRPVPLFGRARRHRNPPARLSSAVEP
eukprot:scaffold22901_cov49-Phaeocystis_antarctica.AAC.1